MRKVEPVFYTDTMMWEVEGCCEPTLRALQSALPHCVFVGYCPSGYEARRETRIFTDRPGRNSPLLFMKKAPAVRRGDDGKFHTVDVRKRGKEIDAWRGEAWATWIRGGVTLVQLAKEYGVSKSAMAGIIQRERIKRAALQTEN